MNLETLKQLQTRLRNSSGADRELDCEIAEYLGGFYRTRLTPEEFAILDAGGDPRPGKKDGAIPSYTASLDACVALLEAAAPGHEWSRDKHGEFIVYEVAPAKIWIVRAIAKPLATDCHTFLDAIFSSLIAQLEATTETVG